MPSVTANGHDADLIAYYTLFHCQISLLPLDLNRGNTCLDRTNDASNNALWYCYYSLANSRWVLWMFNTPAFSSRKWWLYNLLTSEHLGFRGPVGHNQQIVPGSPAAQAGPVFLASLRHEFHTCGGIEGWELRLSPAYRVPP